MTTTHSYDVAVVGAGAAGLSAALVLTRARRSVVVIDAGRPRNAPAAQMHGFLSRDGLPPGELLAAGRAEVASYGGELVDGTVSRVATTADRRFLLHLDGDGAVLARRLLLTTGLRDRLPDLPGVAERWGKDLLHCPYCHGHEVRDQPLGVLGGTPGSVQHALLMRQWSGDVAFLAHTTQLTEAERTELTARGIDIVEGRVERLAVEADRLTGVVLTDGRFVPRTAVFVRPELVGASDLLRDLGGEYDAAGWPVVDQTGRTTLPGVWVAGNAANPRAQVVTAAGEGSAAAIALNQDLVDDDVRSAVAAFRAGRPA